MNTIADILAEKHDAECIQGEGLSIDLCPCTLAQEWRKALRQPTQEIWKMTDHMLGNLKRLVRFTEGCRLDMHEPDEQGLTAKFGPFGYGFDNACCYEPQTGHKTDMGIWLINKESGKREWFNLADLVALARRAA